MESSIENAAVVKYQKKSAKMSGNMSGQMLKRAAVFDRKLAWYIPAEANGVAESYIQESDYLGIEDDSRDVEEV